MFGARSHKDTIDSLMSQLDSVISNREQYGKEREGKIATLKMEYAATGTDSLRYEILGRLFDTYNPYNTDSAYYYGLQREIVARRIGDPAYVSNALMNQASALIAVGMYYEASKITDSISVGDLPDYLVPYYYHIRRTLSGLLAEYSAFSTLRANYNARTKAYRDTLMAVNDENSLPYAITKADQYNSYGQYKRAVEVMKEFMAKNELSEHEIAICAWTLAESYHNLKEKDLEKEQLIISSIGDLKAAVREYVSLRQLALLLYDEGDLERAYHFMNIAIDDATKCNARQRIVEINDNYPQLTGIYVDKVRKQQRALIWALIAITILTLVVVGVLIYLYKQMKVVARSRKELAEANTQLNSLNSELKRSNEKLSSANRAIAENSHLKEIYIGRYMDQCLSYIDNLDSYRKNMLKLLSAGKTEDVKKALKSTEMVEGELKSFYDNFDATFLNLFPTFVEDMNALLLPEEAIIPKKTGSLNTELRIYALIRLGITDSDKIAKFLRYSLTTIYNYRTKVRNKARGDRNKLEAEVMKIGLADNAATIS